MSCRLLIESQISYQVIETLIRCPCTLLMNVDINGGIKNVNEIKLQKHFGKTSVVE